MREKIELQPLGTLPSIGVVPEKMYAWTIRNNRLGSVKFAYKVEVVPVPRLRRKDILVANKFVGINYNGIWAAEGKPKNVVDSNGDYGDEKEDFHICGSESSGIVWAVGSDVTEFQVGDEVCIGGAQFDEACPLIANGVDPCFSPTYRIWGYEGNWGAFAQFSRAHVQQCFKRPEFLSWEESAAFSATGVTAYRMLHHWEGNKIKEGDVVLIWGGAGGLGIPTIQIAKAAGAIPIAVVSDDRKGQICIREGAKGFINRNNFSHWGSIGQMDEKSYRRWIAKATKFRRQIWSIVGETRDPDIVVEHPGRDTLPTSLFVCAPGGMVVLCGATTGYMADVDLRFLWLSQKRVQGCHAGTAEDCKKYIAMMRKDDMHPVIAKVFDWDQLVEGHEMLAQNTGTSGKYVVKIL